MTQAEEGGNNRDEGMRDNRRNSNSHWWDLGSGEFGGGIFKRLTCNRRDLTPTERVFGGLVRLLDDGCLAHPDRGKKGKEVASLGDHWAEPQ